MRTLSPAFDMKFCDAAPTSIADFASYFNNCHCDSVNWQSKSTNQSFLPSSTLKQGAQPYDPSNTRSMFSPFPLSLSKFGNPDDNRNCIPVVNKSDINMATATTATATATAIPQTDIFEPIVTKAIAIAKHNLEVAKLKQHVFRVATTASVSASTEELHHYIQDASSIFQEMHGTLENAISTSSSSSTTTITTTNTSSTKNSDINSTGDGDGDIISSTSSSSVDICEVVEKYVNEEEAFLHLAYDKFFSDSMSKCMIETSKQLNILQSKFLESKSKKETLNKLQQQQQQQPLSKKNGYFDYSSTSLSLSSSSSATLSTSTSTSTSTWSNFSEDEDEDEDASRDEVGMDLDLDRDLDLFEAFDDFLSDDFIL